MNTFSFPKNKTKTKVDDKKGHAYRTRFYGCCSSTASASIAMVYVPAIPYSFILKYSEDIYTHTNLTSCRL